MRVSAISQCERNCRRIAPGSLGQSQYRAYLGYLWRHIPRCRGPWCRRFLEMKLLQLVAPLCNVSR